MSIGAIFSGAQAVGNAGTNDPNVGRAAPISAQQEFMNPIKGFKKDPRSSVAKILDPGAVFLKGKAKFNKPQLRSLSDLTSEARGVFAQNQQGFLQDQLNAQRGTFGDFFDLQAQTLSQGKSLMERLATSDLERRITTENVRAGQAVRGISLSPAAAIQEGVAVSQAQRQAELSALGLGQQLTNFSAQTPLQLQQLNFGQLLQTGNQRELAQAGFSTDAQISNINLERDRRSETMGLLGKLAGSFAGGKQQQGATTLQSSTVGTTQGGGGSVSIPTQSGGNSFNQGKFVPSFGTG